MKNVMRVTPPPILVRSIQGDLDAVRKWSVCSTQKSCFIVRRQHFLLLKRSNFQQETQQT